MAWEPDENVKVTDQDQDDLIIKKLEKISNLANQAIGMLPAKNIGWVAKYKDVPIGIVDKDLVKKHMQSAISDVLTEMQAELQKAIDMTL